MNRDGEDFHQEPPLEEDDQWIQSKMEGMDESGNIRREIWDEMTREQSTAGADSEDDNSHHKRTEYERFQQAEESGREAANSPTC